MTYTVDQLRDHTRYAMEQDYAARAPREDDGTRRQSRADWQAGYLAALERYCPTLAFVRETETTSAA
jgi:hypothetical protein